MCNLCATLCATFDQLVCEFCANCVVLFVRNLYTTRVPFVCSLCTSCVQVCKVQLCLKRNLETLLNEQVTQVNVNESWSLLCVVCCFCLSGASAVFLCDCVVFVVCHDKCVLCSISKSLYINLLIWKATYTCHILIWIISYFGYIYQKECVLYKENRVRVTQIRISHMHAFLYFVFFISILLYFLENGCVFSIVMGEASAWTLGSRTHTAWTNRHPLHSTTLSPQFLFLTKNTILPYTQKLYHSKTHTCVQRKATSIFILFFPHPCKFHLFGQFLFSHKQKVLSPWPPVLVVSV